MIRSTFLRLQPYKSYFFVTFLISSTIVAMAANWGILPDIVPGIPIPDVAFAKGGTILTPAEILAWYSKLQEQEKTTRKQQLYFWITVVDLAAIIPSYTMWMGCEIATLHYWGGMLCHIPVWTALFDLLETGTHFWAIQDRYLHRTSRTVESSSYVFWTPSTSLLSAACLATPFKFLGIFASLILVIVARWQQSRSDKTKEKAQ